MPGLSTDLTDLVVITLIMLLLAMFAPIYGALLALLVFWHAHHHALTVRRRVAGLCAGLALFLNVAFPDVLVPASPAAVSGGEVNQGRQTCLPPLPDQTNAAAQAVIAPIPASTKPQVLRPPM